MGACVGKELTGMRVYAQLMIGQNQESYPPGQRNRCTEEWEVFVCKTFCCNEEGGSLPSLHSLVWSYQ